jgi:hypothetical protein
MLLDGPRAFYISESTVFLIGFANGELWWYRYIDRNVNYYVPLGKRCQTTNFHMWNSGKVSNYGRIISAKCRQGQQLFRSLSILLEDEG